VTTESKYSFIDADGQRQEVALDVTVYKAAAEAGLSLSQYLERTYPSHPDRGSTFAQMMQSCGMYIDSDLETGIRPPSMKAVLDGSATLMAGPLVRNDGTQRNTVSGRLLFPEVILELVAANLTESKDDFLAGYERLIAVNTSVTSPRVDQPTIDVTAPEDSRSQPISQLAEPSTMVSITLAEKSFAIPTKSIGLLVSDQALQATTLDLVGIAMSAQARGERIFMVEEQLGAMMNGDVDWGETALSSITAQSLDSGITSAGEMSQKAWIHYLRDDYRTKSINALMMDIDTALAIEARSGKPTVNTDDPNSPRIDTLFSIENLALPRPFVLLMDTAFIGANTVVGLDTRYAIRRVTNVSAAYEAIEQWVMRRATAFRVDYGEMSKKLYTEAWKKMTLTV
jgi:hypothetical protein